MDKKEQHYTQAINTTLRIGFILLLLVWSFEIVKPFIMPVLWGIIISVSIYPLYTKLAKLLGNKTKLATIIITISLLAIVIIPSFLFIDSAVSGIQGLTSDMENGTLNIPPPNEKVQEWPVVGDAIYDFWALSNNNLRDALEKFTPQIKEFAPKLLSSAAGFGSTILLFIISILIAGALLPTAKASEKTAKSIFNTLLGTHGVGFVELSIATIRSVVQGVLGVAIIQSVAGGLGIMLIGIPAAGLWALIILLLAIMQLPPLLILLPLAIYGFNIADTTPAVIFLIWSILVSASDAFLKPILLGRGVDVPMLAILLGAIGGMMMSGIIGLFVGAVVLSITYKVFKSILVDDILEEEKV
ncbi:MAG: AI-2E family transporter [Bacteroidales bacterium]|nr:AI-2E family transporter [Bacteroidales bacterium]